MRFLLVYGHTDTQLSKDELAALVKKEGAHAAEQYGAGFLLEVWSRGDGQGICAILEAESEEAAQRKLEQFPLRKAGFSKVEQLLVLEPYAGFAHPD